MNARAPRIRSFALRLMLAGTVKFAATVGAMAYTLTEVGEWVVSCDNASTCAAVNASQLNQLRVARPSPYGMARLCIHRRGGAADGPRLYLTARGHEARKPSVAAAERRLRIVDAKSGGADVALLPVGSGHWELPAAQLGAILGRLGDDTQLHILSAEGAVLERLAVDGIGQALSIIDRAQQRAGTVTALRQIGSRPGGDGQGQESPPTLVTAPLPKLPQGVAPSSETVQLGRQVCGLSGTEAMVGHRLLGDAERPDRILWIARCGAPSRPRLDLYVIEEADGRAAPITLPGTQPERPTGRAGLLAASILDAEAGLLRERWIALAPMPGGACAIQRLWGWNGRAFELAEERRSLSCAGIVSGYWPRTFTRPLITPAAPGAAADASAFRPPCW